MAQNPSFGNGDTHQRSRVPSYTPESLSDRKFRLSVWWLGDLGDCGDDGADYPDAD
jgi:hypothetical protein